MSPDSLVQVASTVSGVDPGWIVFIVLGVIIFALALLGPDILTALANRRPKAE